MTFSILQLRRTYKRLQQLPADQSITDRLLAHLNVSHRTTDRDLANIPRTGATIAVANHPFGVLEGALLASLLRSIRPDVRILANPALAAVPELRDLITPANKHGLRDAIAHLHNGGLLLVFPSGEVSRRNGDPPWNATVARLIQRTSATTIPIFIAGTNSALFHAAGRIHPSLRSALLAHELHNKRGATIDIRIGAPVSAADLASLGDPRQQTDHLRQQTYLPQDLQQLTPIATSGDFDAYIARAPEIPHILPEIGRLREIAFRAAGEGTGHATDLDAFDPHYLHLFVWHRTKGEVAGAYRLSGTEAGPTRLYTSTLFHYGQPFLKALGPALELGRSFVRLDYQKSFTPLLLLWKGIGAYLAANPRYRTLFGPVSISNRYRAASRELMIAFLERHASLSGWSDLVAPSHPPHYAAPSAIASTLDQLNAAVSAIEPDRAGVPVLLRQYLKLGGKLLGFSVDPAFSNALDGLIVVDLSRTDPSLLNRYLGAPQAAQFLDHQKGTHARPVYAPHQVVLDY